MALTVTATDLPRLMACNGSRLMGGSTPPVNAADTVRDEGNAADWLVAQVYSGKFTAEELVDRAAPNGIYITVEMVEYLEEYLKDIQNSQIEVDTSYAGQNWQVNGRADRIAYKPASAHLIVGDLKYGWGIIEPHGNWTLISHAVGWIARNPTLPVNEISFIIFQPRPYHPDGQIRTWTITREHLMELYGQINATLSNPSDMLVTGSHCYRCPALALCPAARLAQMNAIDASEQAFEDDIDNENLSFQLDHIARAIKVLEQRFDAFKELATHRVRHGEVVRNYVLENELTNRQWKGHVTPELLTIMTGKDLTKKNLITPNQAEKAGVSKDVVAAFTERRNKGVKLVRKDIDAQARKMFNPDKRN